MTDTDPARVMGQGRMRNHSHDPNIERHGQGLDVVQPAPRTATEPAAGPARWVAVRGRRLAGQRPVDPDGSLEVDTLRCAAASPPASTVGASTVDDVSEPCSPPGTDIDIGAPQATEPCGRDTFRSTRQLGERTCDNGAPTGARLLPVGTHALRIVMTNSNGRRRWAVDVLVRQPVTSSKTT